jgi:F0F1-type ATP synthase assembly protein I
MTWVVSVALLAYLGHLLDGAVGSSPLFLVVGALAGAAGGFLHFLSRVAPELLPFGRGRGAQRQATDGRDGPNNTTE